MPESPPFTVLGRGNGFPFCLPRADVDPFDLWTTLGGYNKTNADAGTPVTQEQIDLSLANAMKLFWNFYQLTGEATGFKHDFDPEPSENITNPASWLTPSDRICEDYTYPTLLLAYGVNRSEGTPYTEIRVQANIARFYNNDNFIGYGLFIVPTLSIGTAKAEVFAFAEGRNLSSLGGYSAFVSLSGVDYTGIVDSDRAVDYCTVSGIPFVGVAAQSGLNPGIGGTVSLVVENDNISANVDNGLDNNVKASITGLEFYTYA